MRQKKEKRYSCIQLTVGYKNYLEKVKEVNHFDSYESTIKYLIKEGA